MIIFWGSTTITKTLGEGAFYCPRCRAHASYGHRLVREWFTLYFIPLFPTSTIGEFIECKECGTNFHPSILERTPEQIEAMLKPWKCADCQGLNPPSEMHCLVCKTRRPQQDTADHAAAPGKGSDNGALRDTTPAPKPKPSMANALNSSRDLAAVLAGQKCRQCGVTNSVVALHCKGCGCRLTEKGDIKA